MFEGRRMGGDGDDILDSSGQLAANIMYGSAGADEVRCNGENGVDAAEDYNEEEGDIIVSECEQINGVMPRPRLLEELEPIIPDEKKKLHAKLRQRNNNHWRN